MCNFTWDIEVTKEEIENAMLLPGEYVKKDGKYYIAGPGMLDGYVCPCIDMHVKDGEEICLSEEAIERLFGRLSKPK